MAEPRCICSTQLGNVWELWSTKLSRTRFTKRGSESLQELCCDRINAGRVSCRVVQSILSCKLYESKFSFFTVHPGLIWKDLQHRNRPAGIAICSEALLLTLANPARRNAFARVRQIGEQ